MIQLQQEMVDSYYAHGVRVKSKFMISFSIKSITFSIESIIFSMKFIIISFVLA